ncbi:unnamed protein product [Prorocentrum cordatum]|uniref:Uncharacterized protein n=1 Tax=Prorocentrum cordatum TaxID=2364126 RepID=A0ABN9RTE0_9DINO|nr:unnamed protein product [Polarella glacialis]
MAQLRSPSPTCPAQSCSVRPRGAGVAGEGGEELPGGAASKGRASSAGPVSPRSTGRGQEGCQAQGPAALYRRWLEEHRPRAKRWLQEAWAEEEARRQPQLSAGTRRILNSQGLQRSAGDAVVHERLYNDFHKRQAELSRRREAAEASVAVDARPWVCDGTQRLMSEEIAAVRPQIAAARRQKGSGPRGAAPGAAMAAAAEIVWQKCRLPVTVESLRSYDVVEVLRLALSTGRIGKRTEMSEETKRARDALADCPMNMCRINELGRCYANEAQYDKCEIALLRGWKRANEIEDASIRFCFLLKLCESSYYQLSIGRRWPCSRT